MNDPARLLEQLPVVEVRPDFVGGIMRASPFPQAARPAPAMTEALALAQAPVVEVPLDALQSSQESISEAGVLEALSWEPQGDDELPYVYEREDGFAIADGHHRLVAALLRGATTARVRVIPLAPLEAPAPSQMRAEAPVIAPELVETARAYATAEPSNTERTYRSQLKIYSRWCAAQVPPIPPLPVLPPVLTAYIADRAKSGIGVSSLEVALAALIRANADIGQTNPTDNPVFQKVWRGIRFVEGEEIRQATPFTSEQLRRFAELTAGADLRALRDRALLLTAFAGALRQSEVVALRFEDLSFVPEGLDIRIRQSKTDQTRRGEEVSIPRMMGDADPGAALRAWLEASGISSGPVFKRITGQRVWGRALSTRMVERIVDKAAVALGLDPKDYSGHSMRAGFATEAFKRGVPLIAIAKHGRWSRLDTAAGYIRKQERFKSNAAEGLL